MKLLTICSKYLPTFLPVLMFMLIPVSVQARSTPVSVQNFPEVQVVEDVNHRSKQPYHWDDFRSYSIDTPTSLSLGVSTEVVPEGKILIIEHLSYRASSKGFNGAPSITLDVLAVDPEGRLSWVVTHQLIPQRYQLPYDRLAYTGSQPMKLVIEAGMKVQISLGTVVDDDASIKAGISGYLVDTD